MASGRELKIGVMAMSASVESVISLSLKYLCFVVII